MPGRDRLLNAAWRLLMDQAGNWERISVAQVCEKAACSPPTLYHHFADLPALLAAAGRRAFDDWARDMEPRVGGEPDPRRRLRLRGQAYLDWALDHQPAYRAMFPAQPGPPAGEGGPGPAFTGLLADVAEVLDAGAEDPRVLTAALAHWAAVHGVATLAMAAPELPKPAWTATLDHLTTALAAQFAEHT